MANGIQSGQNSLSLAPSGQSQAREQLAQSLLAGGSSMQPARGGLVEALARMGQGYFGGKMQGEVQGQRDERRQALADTLQRATQATQPGATAQNPMVGPTQMSDSQRMAAILGQNPDTAPMALQLSMDEATREPQSRKITVPGSVANERLGTSYSPESAVTMEVGPRGMSVSRVDEPPEREQSSVNAQFQAVNKDSGERETLLRTDRGLFRQSVQDGQPVMTPVDSSRYRPVQTSEQGPSAELSGLGSTEQRKLRNAEVAARELVATTGDALRLLEKDPDVNTWTASAGALVNDLQQEGQALARGLGLEFDEDVIDPSKYQDSFDELGINNRRMKSLVTSLAFQAAAASGQTGRSVSDTDVRRFIAEVGASSADPRAFAQTLRDVAERGIRRFRTNYEVRTGNTYEGGLGFDGLPNPYQGQQQGGGSAVDAETQQLLEKYQ